MFEQLVVHSGSLICTATVYEYCYQKFAFCIGRKEVIKGSAAMVTEPNIDI